MSLKPHRRASMVKLINEWIRTQAFLHRQNWTPSPLCTRCHIHEENIHHIFQCTAQEATIFRDNKPTIFLQLLLDYGTPTQIIAILKINISTTLHIPNRNQFYQDALDISQQNTLTTTIRHQNKIGWHLFLKGYTSKRWLQLFSELCPDTDNAPQPEYSLTFLTHSQYTEFPEKNMGR